MSGPDSFINRNIEDAVKHHQAGRLEDAERLYRAIINVVPDHPDANHNLGVLAVQCGEPEAGLPNLKKALESVPEQALYWFSYIDALIKAGQLQDARQVLQKGRQLGLKGKSVDELQRLLDAPSEKEIDALFQAFEKGDFAVVERLASEMTRKFPDFPLGWKALGVSLQSMARTMDALIPMQRAVQSAPRDAQAHSNLGNVMRHLGRLDEAESSCRRAIALKPDLDQAHNNLGNVFRDLGRLAEAQACYMKAISINPDLAEAHGNLGAILYYLNRYNEAEKSLLRCIEIKPDCSDALLDLGNVIRDLGRFEEAEALHRRSLAFNPGRFECHSSLLMGFSYQSNMRNALSDAVKYGDAVSKKATPFDSWSCSKEEKIRVGLVSGDFRNHPVGHFLEAIIAGLDPEKIELIAYPTSPLTDALTARIRPHFRQWHPICGLNDESAAMLIHSHGPHIMIDLSGHTAQNRLPVFAWKPAPVQVSWLGYFATTGLAEMDYILGDPYVTPPGSENQFVENIWRMPETRMCFTPPRDAPEISPLPALKNGHFTFGSFQNLAKVSDETLEIWSKVLKALPDSRLRWQCRQFNEPAAIVNTLDRMETRGIAQSRVTLIGPVSRLDYLASHCEVDFILDTFPFTGGTTTCEALWMGVPTLTLAGNTMISRQGMGIMTAAGLPQWCAHAAEEYVSKAVSLAASIENLSALRMELREKVGSSPLFDSRRFARHFEEAMSEMRQA